MLELKTDILLTCIIFARVFKTLERNILSLCLLYAIKYHLFHFTVGLRNSS